MNLKFFNNNQDPILPNMFEYQSPSTTLTVLMFNRTVIS